MNKIIAIHGVGPQEPQIIRNRIKENLKGDSIDIHVEEFNWASWKRRSLIEGLAGIKVIFELLQTLNNAAFAEHRTINRLKLSPAAKLAELGRSMIFLAISLLTPIWAIVKTASYAIDIEYFMGSVSAAWATTAGAMIIVGATISLSSILLSLHKTDGLSRYQSFIVALRRVVLSHAAPLVAIACAPLLAKRNNIARLGTVLLGTGLSGIAAMTATIALLEMLSSGDGQSQLNEVVSTVLPISLILITSVPLAYLTAMCLEKISPAVIETSLDVLRYVGDHQYRTQLLDQLDCHVTSEDQRRGDRSSELDLCYSLSTSISSPVTSTSSPFSSIPSTARLYILAHSLGSVIAIDYLINRDTRPPGRQLTLVTGGSPVRRFFQTFFPNLLFEANTRNIAIALSAKYTSFVWANVYRPNDPIGCALGLDNLSFAADVDSEQAKGFLTAHVGYWSDAIILSKIKSALGRLRPHEIHNHETTKEASTTETAQIKLHDAMLPMRDYMNRTYSWLPMPLAAVAATIAFTGALLVLACETADFCHVFLNARQEHSLLEKEGISTKCSVYYERTNAILARAATTWTDRYIFLFKDKGGKDRIISHDVRKDADNSFVPRNYIDFSKLREAIRSQGNYVGPGSLGQGESFRPKRLSNVPLRYNPRDSSVFDLPDFVSTPSLSRASVDFTTVAFMPVVLCLFFVGTFLFLALGTAVPLLLWAASCSLLIRTNDEFRLGRHVLNKSLVKSIFGRVVQL